MPSDHVANGISSRFTGDIRIVDRIDSTDQMFVKINKYRIFSPVNSI
ncbi:MAG: hypothetical protein ISR89_07030 [Candidatus Marinimicrobia bacterium]|nr:hypothetical protein [Candidatus Neomarinimicrobiota bacterium]MBL7030901.1 hypothetical protein [Candidatus Neomarinimicrobiota bacterium]